MFEKERTRLKSEEIRIMLRLEFIQNRLKEIQDYYDEKAGQMQAPGQGGQKEPIAEVPKSGFKTMSIDY
jgi:hypothetical protein